MPLEQQGQGAGGEHFAQHHPQHHNAHRLLCRAGEQGGQQSQHRPRPDDLLGGLRGGGGAHPANAVETVLVEVFHPGEQQAGHQQHHAQTGAGIPQEIDGDGVGQYHHHNAQGDRQQEKAPQRPAEDGLYGAVVLQRVVAGGQGGHRHGQSHGGERHEHGEYRHHQLEQPHGFRADHTGEDHTVYKPHHLGKQSGGGEQQGASQQSRQERASFTIQTKHLRSDNGRCYA